MDKHSKPLCLFVSAVENLILEGIAELRQRQKNQEVKLDAIMANLDTGAEPSELPETIDLPLKTMEDVDELESILQDPANDKALVSSTTTLLN